MILYIYLGDFYPHIFAESYNFPAHKEQKEVTLGVIFNCCILSSNFCFLLYLTLMLLCT
jgi:hypothetical protein